MGPCLRRGPAGTRARINTDLTRTAEGFKLGKGMPNNSFGQVQYHALATSGFGTCQELAGWLVLGGNRTYSPDGMGMAHDDDHSFIQKENGPIQTGADRLNVEVRAYIKQNEHQKIPFNDQIDALHIASTSLDVMDKQCSTCSENRIVKNAL
jgi:hypothetical protein